MLVDDRAADETSYHACDNGDKNSIKQEEMPSRPSLSSCSVLLSRVLEHDLLLAVVMSNIAGNRVLVARSPEFCDCFR